MNVKTILLYAIILIVLFIITGFCVSNKIKTIKNESYNNGYNACTLEFTSKTSQILAQNEEKVKTISNELTLLRKKYNEKKNNITCAELYAIRIPSECVPSNSSN